VTTDPARHLAEAELYTRSASRLTELFYTQLDDIGRFEPVAVDDMPQAARTLLAHREHMTVALENYHHSPVSVRAVSEWQDDASYARASLLSRQSDGAIIQFGIMRIWLADLPQDARREITHEKQPLGRVLIAHNMLREVEVIALWRITPGEVLHQLLGVTDQSPVYGRSAQILVDERPTVQVLEIVKLTN
jgi:chorismate-pyruvate lyase